MSRAFRLLRVDHTGVTVSDIEASLQVWCETLGFTLLYRAKREGVFAAEVTGVAGAEILIAVVEGFGHKIELLQYIAPDGRAIVKPRPCDVGSLHLAVDVDDLDAALDTLSAQGWTAAGVPQVIEHGGRIGTRLVYVRDPDGITLELMQPRR